MKNLTGQTAEPGNGLGPGVPLVGGVGPAKTQPAIMKTTNESQLRRDDQEAVQDLHQPIRNYDRKTVTTRRPCSKSQLTAKLGLVALALLAGTASIAAQPSVSIGSAALVEVKGIPGTTYAVQAAKDLSAPAWQTLAIAGADAAGTLVLADPSAGNPQRYYRALELHTIDLTSASDHDLKTASVRYRLIEDLSNLSSPITISADNVILDLNGHTITGSGTGTGIQVTGFAGALITGGMLRNFETAVLLEQTRAVHLKSLTIVGIGVTNDNWAIRAVNSSELRIQGCDLSNTHNPAKIEGVTLSEIDHCVVHDNDKGLYLTASSTGNRVHHNAVSGSPKQPGIIADTQSNQNHLYANLCTGNLVGIEIDGADDNVIHDNIANENVWGGLWVRHGAHNVVRHNTALRNGTPTFVRWGILLGFPKAFGGPLYATGTLVDDNTALDNADSHPAYGAYQIDVFDNSIWDKQECENTWLNNTFVKDNEKDANFGPVTGCVQ